MSDVGFQRLNRRGLRLIWNSWVAKHLKLTTGGVVMTLTAVALPW